MTSVCQECGKAITASRMAVEYPKDHPTPTAIPHADVPCRYCGELGDCGHY
jgi:hypothetical protein